jgi:hypothetical protein
MYSLKIKVPLPEIRNLVLPRVRFLRAFKLSLKVYPKNRIVMSKIYVEIPFGTIRCPPKKACPSIEIDGAFIHALVALRLASIAAPMVVLIHGHPYN